MNAPVPKPSMTIADAIQEAQRIRTMPSEYLVTQEKLKLINSTLLSAIESSPCLLKALEAGEEVFVLRQRDRAAPQTIEAWSEIAEAHGCNEEKVKEASVTAMRWRGQNHLLTRWPT